MDELFKLDVGGRDAARRRWGGEKVVAESPVLCSKSHEGTWDL